MLLLFILGFFIEHNENKMIRMKAILKEKYSKFITYECSAYFMNLLKNDLSPKTIFKHIIEVHKYFRNYNLLHVSGSFFCP